MDFFFPRDAKSNPHSPRAVANLKDSSCCIIKPHAVREGKAGDIITDIQRSGFNISGLQTLNLRYQHAEEFYEIYKGVVHDYTVSAGCDGSKFLAINGFFLFFF